MNKTINIVCHYASIYGGNFIPSILRVASFLEKKNYTVIFTFPNEAVGRDWIKYLKELQFRLCFADFSKKAFSKEIKSINKRNKVDILYSHFISGLRIKLIYPICKKIKLLIHIHSDFSAGKSSNFFDKIKSFIEHHLLRRDARYIFVSKTMASKFEGRGGYIYVQNALSLDRIPCNKIDLNKLKSDTHINDDDTVFLVFAWSPFVKGIDIAVRGFLDGAKKSDNAKLIIVYGKNDGYKNCVSYLTKILRSDSFLNDKRIIFLPPSEDVFSYYQLSDVFISSSRSEGFSYSILEALYCNLRVLSSNIAGTKWAEKYENVSSFDVDNNGELSALITNNIGYKKINYCNEMILHDFDIDLWCNSIIEQIEKL